jgi:hypothetical protein
MAAPSVSADVTRVAEATITPDTGTWGNDGGGGGVSDEPDVVYQGTTSQSRKISTSVIGRSYTHGSGTDMDGTPTNTMHYIAKVNVTNYAALLSRTSPALHMKIGSSSGNYHTYYLFGNDNYPPLGGWQIIAIAPSISGYTSVADTGTPNDSSILFWSLLADFSATSKSENVMIDAIDVGAGLYLVGGDGASTDAVFQDFVDFDEGTSANRYGFVTTRQGVIYCIGELGIGTTSAGTSTHTDFTDSGVTLVWENGLVASGFHSFLLDVATSGTVIQMTNCTLGSVGKIDNDGDRGATTTEDSRPTFTVTGTVGTATLTACVIDNFASFTLNSATTFANCVITNCGQMVPGSTTTAADLAGTSISGYTGAANTSAILWNFNLNPSTLFDGMTFEANGSTLSHAIEFGVNSPTTIDLTNIDFVGYSASNNVNDSVLHIKRTSGTVTINVSGGSGTVSYRTDGATVNVVNSVTVSVNVKDATTLANIQNARVVVRAETGGPEPYEDSVTITTATTTATVTHTAHGLATGNEVEIRGANERELNQVTSITVTGVNTYTYTITSIASAPGTGTITSTRVLVSGLTDANGNVSNTGYNFSTDQDIAGRVRKSTSSPFYKTCGLVGTVVSGGLALTCLMIPDE